MMRLYCRKLRFGRVSWHTFRVLAVCYDGGLKTMIVQDLVNNLIFLEVRLRSLVDNISRASARSRYEAMMHAANLLTASV